MQHVHLIAASFYYNGITCSKLFIYYSNINNFLSISITRLGLQSGEMRLFTGDLAQRVYRDVFN